MEEIEEQRNKISLLEVNKLFLASSLMQFFVSITLSIILGIIIGIVFETGKEINMDDYQNIFSYISIPLIEFFSFIFPVILFIQVKKIDVKKLLRLNKLQIKFIFPLIIIGICTQFVGMFINNIVIFVLQLFGNVPAKGISAPNNMLEIIILIVVIGVVPAICEEIFARGIILSTFQRRNITNGVIISAILFAIMHFDITNFAFPLFLGLILAYVVYRTDSVYSGMIVHFVSNALGVIILFFFKPPEFEYIPQINMAEMVLPFVAALIAALILLIAIIYIKRYSNINNLLVDIDETDDTKMSISNSWPLLITLLILIIIFSNSIINISKL